MSYPLIPIGNNAYLSETPQSIPELQHLYIVTIENKTSTTLRIPELADYGSLDPSDYKVSRRSTATFTFNYDEKSGVDSTIADAIGDPPDPSSYVVTTSDEYMVDPTKYCWVGGRTQFMDHGGQYSHGTDTIVEYGYANGTDPSAPGWGTITVLCHVGVWSWTHGVQYVGDINCTGDRHNGGSSGSIGGDALRICIDTHGHDQYTDSADYVRTKLSRNDDTNNPVYPIHQFDLDGDLGNVGSYYSDLVQYPLPIDSTIYTYWRRVFTLDVYYPGTGYVSENYNASYMLNDAGIVDIMNQGYVYPWVSCASDAITLPTGRSASYVLDTSNPVGDWGWVAESESFSDHIKVCVPPGTRDETNRWKDIPSLKIQVGGNFKPVKQIKVRDVDGNNQPVWKSVPSVTTVGLT